MIMMACCLLFAATLVTANAAIGRECYDNNKEFSEKDDIRKNNNKFLLGSVITGPICIFCALVAFGLAVKFA